MAKLTKSVLKGIVKECLVEILSEGLLGDQALTESRKTTTLKTRQKTKKTSTGQSRRPESSPQFRKKVQETSRALTEDPVMAAIFEDTARTTLQEQIQNESTPMVPRHDFSESASVGNEAPVEDLFEGSSNWATLAFSEKKNI